MKIFVINLDHRNDRRAFIERQLKNLGLEAEFISATDGRNLTLAEAQLYDESLSRKYNGKPLAPGELGCAISHRSIYERMDRDGISRALVLEDDISLSRGLASLLANDALLASGPWSWLQIDYPEVGMAFFTRWIRSSFIEIRRKPLFAIYAFAKLPYMIALCAYERAREAFALTPRIVRFARPLYFAGCYIITLEGARILLALSPSVVYPADRLPNQARKISRFRMRAIVPRLVRQERDKFPSDIG